MSKQWKQWALKKNPELIDRKVIEDIKQEIEESRYGLVNDGLDLALKIIDKHINGEERK